MEESSSKMNGVIKASNRVMNGVILSFEKYPNRRRPKRDATPFAIVGVGEGAEWGASRGS